MNLNNLLKKSLHKVDEEILMRLDATVPLLSKIGSHLIKVKGKRIRPSLTLAMSAQLNDFSRNPILLATAVEFIHTATLLHDDVVDQSNLRRGIKSANIIWGNEASVLAGDFLFAQSFDLMVETKSLKALSVLAQASCKITQGEFLQMQISNKPNTKISDYFSVIGGKTAQLFGASAQSGAIVANGSLQQVKAAFDYGYNMGLAFQIIDDIMDYSSSKTQMGKNQGDDFKLGKTTLPIILAWEKSNKLEREFFLKSLQELKQEKGDFEKCCEILKKYSILNRCKKIANDFVIKAINALNEFSENDYKKALIELANSSLSRDN